MSLTFTFSILIEGADEGPFIAHCLELDLVADGPDVEEALASLDRVIRTHFEACEDYGTPLFSPAPKDYWDRFEKAEPYYPETRPFEVGEQGHSPRVFDHYCLNVFKAGAPSGSYVAHA